MGCLGLGIGTWFRDIRAYDRVQGLGFSVYGLGFRFQGSGCG